MSAGIRSGAAINPSGRRALVSLLARLLPALLDFCLQLVFLPWLVTLSPFSLSYSRLSFRKVGARLCRVRGPAQSSLGSDYCRHQALLPLRRGVSNQCWTGRAAGVGSDSGHHHKTQRQLTITESGPWAKHLTILIEFFPYPPKKWVPLSLQESSLLG